MTTAGHYPPIEAHGLTLSQDLCSRANSHIGLISTAVNLARHTRVEHPRRSSSAGTE